MFCLTESSNVTKDDKPPVKNKTDKLRKSVSETMIVGGVAIAMPLKTEVPISVQSSTSSLKQMANDQKPVVSMTDQTC